MASVMPSLAGLIFNGRLEAYFATGLGVAFVSLIVMIILTAIFGADRATLAVPQSPTVLVQGAIIANVMALAPAGMSLQEQAALALIILTLTSVAVGCFLWMLGALRAGGLIRHVPYPIAGGIVAGVGWLMFSAGFLVAVGIRVKLANMPLLLEGGVLARWLPSLAFALSVMVLQARVKSLITIPGAIVGALILFYLWLVLWVEDVAVLREGGWFVPEAPDGIIWRLPDFGVVASINLDMLAAIASGMVTLLVIWTLNLFFKASAQELVVDREIDINRECSVNGIANVAAGLCGGGMPGFHTVGFAAMMESLRVNGRLVAFILVLLLLPTLALGNSLYALIPRFIPGGLMMFFGLLFLKEWLLDSRSNLSWKDYLVVVVIALTSAMFGMLASIGVGIILAISFFVLEYSRMEVIKQELSASIHRSNLDRSFAQNRFLQIEGEQVLILRLQGFVFFGSAYRFYEHVKRRIGAADLVRPRFLILDFHAVRGLDASAIHDFEKLLRLSDKEAFALLFSSVRPNLQKALNDGGIMAPGPGAPSIYDDLDHALEWCENRLLAEADLLAHESVTVAQQLAQHAILPGQDISALLGFLERMETRVGDTVFRQGDESDALYFIESGRVDVLLQVEGDHPLRLRSMTAGTVVGEVGFYLKQARTASVVVTEAGVLQRLSLTAMSEMVETAPHAAAAIHVFITRVLSDRLSTSNRLVQELMD